MAARDGWTLPERDDRRRCHHPAPIRQGPGTGTAVQDEGAVVMKQDQKISPQDLGRVVVQQWADHIGISCPSGSGVLVRHESQ